MPNPQQDTTRQLISVLRANLTVRSSSSRGLRSWCDSLRLSRILGTTATTGARRNVTDCQRRVIINRLMCVVFREIAAGRKKGAVR